MNRTSTMVAAALVGLFAGAQGCSKGDAAPSDKSGSSTLSSGAKHACKGQNACKGQGGCKTDTHACKGQNACKGQGGCSMS